MTDPAHDPDIPVVELAARPFAAAWLNVARAASDEQDLIPLYRTVLVEILDDHTVRLMSTDSVMLLTSHVRLDRDAPSWSGLVTADELPVATPVAMDWDHRATALCKFIFKDTKETPTTLMRLWVGPMPDVDGAPTLGEDVARDGLTLEYVNERLTLPLYEGDPVDWRRILSGREQCACDTIGYNPNHLARLGGMYSAGATSGTLTMHLAGPLGITAVHVDVEPPVTGGLMPARIGAEAEEAA